MEEEHSDNFIFSIAALAAGCGIGFLLAIGIAYSFHLNTFEPTLVVPPTWVTPTPMWDSSSLEDTYTNKYAVYGIAVLAVGLMLCPTALLAIVVWRRVRSDDVCSQDKLGVGIVVLGTLCGLAVGLGSFYAAGWGTHGSTGGGIFLLILVPFSIVITVLLLVCYRHHKETGSYYGGIFYKETGSYYGGIF